MRLVRSVPGNGLARLMDRRTGRFDPRQPDLCESGADGARARPGTVRRLAGDEARVLIEKQLAAHSRGVLAALSKYRLAEAVSAWHETIRAIEEFINIPLFGTKDPRLEGWLRAVPLDGRFMANPGPVWAAVQQALTPHFKADVVRRFLRTMLQTAAIASAFKMHGQANFGPGTMLNTVGAAVNYFQSRRRHLVSLLYTLPFACRGADVLAPLDALNVLLPQIEHSCVAITGFHQKLAMLDVLDGFVLEVDSSGAMASHAFETLESYFIDPERASIHVMAELRRDQFVVPEMETLDSKTIFSAAELRNSAKLIGATYAAFGLNDSDFSSMVQLIIAFSRYCRDDYFVEMEKPKFQAMLRAQASLDADELERLLVNAPSDYAINTNAYEPFIDLGDRVVSNVNLLLRFLYAFKKVHLGSRRRFQIHAGFIFEDMVKRDLEAMGFHVTGIKRINRKEFDVVATHCGVIYNFQCKNNWIDLAKLESDTALFVCYNRSLVNYYRRALAKERKREHLLKGELGLEKVEHYVISRFPVIGADPRVINYNQIDQLWAVTGGAA
jgi:hypothetical protein